MSYILDALKKSEAERLRRDTPGFADVPQQARAARTPRWIWLVGALLLVNAIVVSALLLRPREAPPAAQDGAAAAAAVDFPAAAVRADAPPAAASAPPASSITTPGADRGKRSPAAPAADPGRPPPAVRPAAPVAPAPPPAPATLPRTFMELRADGTLSLPDLHLDIHVYSSRPAERFVFVNMSKYREQESLAEGPLVREINAEGVILEYRGTVFLLPRE